MSNLFKSGFPGIKTVDAKPFVIDGNKKQISIPETTGKIIRPLDESKNEDENENASPVNEELLNEAMDMAKELRDDAVNRANKIIEDAKAQAELIKENAYKEAYEKGY